MGQEWHIISHSCPTWVVRLFNELHCYTNQWCSSALKYTPVRTSSSLCHYMPSMWCHTNTHFAAINQSVFLLHRPSTQSPLLWRKKTVITSHITSWPTNCLNLNLNWVTTLRISRRCLRVGRRVGRRDVELSWVALLRYKRAYDATQLNSTSSWVELSCVAAL